MSSLSNTPTSDVSTPRPLTSEWPRRIVRFVTAVLVSLALALGSVAVTAAPASAARKSVATHAEYKRIHDGQSLGHVRKIIGVSGEQLQSGVYRWKSTHGRIVVVFFDGGQVVGKERLVVASLKEYKKIKKGQKYTRVKKIIGGLSQVSYQADDVRYRLWLSPDLRKTIVIRFAHGKVIGKERSNDGGPAAFAAR